MVLSAVAHAVLLNAMPTAVIAPDAHPIFHLMMPYLNTVVSRRRYLDVDKDLTFTLIQAMAPAKFADRLAILTSATLGRQKG